MCSGTFSTWISSVPSYSLCFLPYSTCAPHRCRHCCASLHPWLMLLPFQSSKHMLSLLLSQRLCGSCSITWNAPSRYPHGLLLHFLHAFPSNIPLSARSSQILKWKKANHPSSRPHPLHPSYPALLFSIVIFIIWLPTYLLLIYFCLPVASKFPEGKDLFILFSDVSKCLWQCLGCSRH